MTYYYMEPNGEIVTNDSRRQEQFIGMNVLPFYLDYRRMAVHDSNAEFTAISKQIEQTKGFDKKNNARFIGIIYRRFRFMQDFAQTCNFKHEFRPVFQDNQFGKNS